jgi:poly(3-hydroxybutyrate) depolymerase
MAEADDPLQPRSMTLISGPIDPRVSPTKVNRFADEHSLAWLETSLIYRVPPPLPGYGRRVYPGALQLQAFMSLGLSRHVEAHLRNFVEVAAGNDGDHEAIRKHRAFYDEYFAVLDLPAEFYLETVGEVFQEHRLAKGTMVHRGRPVRPEAIEKTALLTIEGGKDDITGLGQTEAAHALATAIPAFMREKHVESAVGHYGTFSGRRWRESIAPLVRAFIRDHA